MKTKFILRVALFVVLGCAFGQAAEMAGEPHVYKKVEGRELTLHVFKPKDWKASDQRPALVFFHGGGWTGGAPTAFARQSEYFASRGLVTMSVQYRLMEKAAPVAPFPCMHDAKSAMRWVRAHAKELGIDAARIAAGGGSAGGHLAAFTGLVSGYDDPADDLSVVARPAALLLFNPFVGFKASAATEADARLAARFGPQGKAFLASTPANHVKKDAPPTVIFHGADDVLVPVSQVKDFAAELKAAGARCELIVYEGQGHSFFNRGKSYYETVIAADKFLASLGWLQGPPTLTVPADADAANGAAKGKKRKAGK
jgi:acetyl esterase